MDTSVTQQDKIGQVSSERYHQLVARILQIDEQQTRGRFEIGDAGLEIEPIQPVGGSRPGSDLFGVEASLQRLSDDTRIPVNTLKTLRWVASRWPVEHRQAGVSFGVHKILADIPEDAERWARITKPPLNERTGRHEWTEDAARREVGQKVSNPVSVTEKVTAIHDLARDEQVAASAVTDLLRRPNVAFKAMSDQVARHMVNRAQVDRSVQAAERHQAPARPAIERTRQAAQFLDLIAACSAFVAAVGRTMPTLHGHTFTEQEREVILAQIAKVRATTDWIETAVETGNLSLDEALANLLRGE
ncbi:DUF6192 family protein [Nonomuraea aridisoli]|uniref:RacO protein n=1 Tax=Nonomuraea aridisoli TaxID=2070368 RepID=A0A2W2EHM9_9ACTN|nr:DUF6192 family protein [Nonomuraea aridisoli]PZG21843.1 RacO protein [Nonomuraea aridisoli]